MRELRENPLNLITAIATAYMDSVPMVIITGQVNSDQIGRDVFQEADITGSAEPFVKHSYLLKKPEDTAEVFKKAFYIAGTGRRGPVLIDVPTDVQLAEIDFEYPETVDIRSYRPSSKGNGYQIKRAAATMLEAKKPLIIAGGGLFSGNAAELMRKLSEKLDIPVISTLMGLGAMPTDNERYFGMLGMHGCESAKCAVNNCDTLILLGARLSDRTTAPILLKKELTVIHIDIDPAEIGKSVAANIPIVGDISIVLGQLLEQLDLITSEKPDHGEWKKMLSDSRIDKGIKPVEQGFVNPKWFIRELNKYLPSRSIVVADVGENQFWTALNIELKNGRFLTSGGMGTMGYSLPAAIGAKKAEPNAEVIAVCGDGSFQMEMPELATCVQHDIPVKVIVMRNKYLGMVREFQTNHYGNRLYAVNLDGSPSYTKIAEAYGIENMLVDSEASAKEGIKRLTESKKPFLLEVAVPEMLETIL